MITGIRTLEDLRDRCWVDEDTGCWHWRCAVSGGQPKSWLPAQQRVVSLSIIVGVITTGAPPAVGMTWRVTCKTKHCANPEHRKLSTFKTAMKTANMKHTPMHRIKIAAAKRAQSHISDEVVKAIRASHEYAYVLAVRYGVSRATAYRIKRGTARAPLSAPGSSVFAFGRAT